MPELFLELFGEEIPARMQAGGATELERLMTAALAPLHPVDVETFHGPRRIAARTDVDAQVAATRIVERGPRRSAPEQALSGFIRKHNASREDLRHEGEHWVLEKTAAAVSAASLIAEALPPLLRRFHWPKSMRWGGSSAFTWVRPLRRIVCLLDGEVVRFDLRDGTDDGHRLRSGDLTEGHRFLAPGAFQVRSCADWRDKLGERYVLVDATERRRRIASGLQAEAAARDLEVVDDPGLLDEVAGLVEWPVPLLGRIDQAFMDLPPEVLQVSMRLNQRYFSLRTSEGTAAPWFGFVANIEADDGGAAIIAGNERVLRARFADARYFWDFDRKASLASRVKLLDAITFHAKLGSQGDRVRRLEELSVMVGQLMVSEATIAERNGYLAQGSAGRLMAAGSDLSRRAAHLCKADLTTGMVGEFPELQGVMGRYYALHDGEEPAVADAIRDHYSPKGVQDKVPSAPVSIAVALADKVDLLTRFFAIGEEPTGSGDPYALRRAAQGIIRIIRDNNLRIRLLPIFAAAGISGHAGLGERLLDFIFERLRVQLRTEGARHDVITAISAYRDDDLCRVLARASAITEFLESADGANLLVAYRRAANILRIESKGGEDFTDRPEASLLRQPEEMSLQSAVNELEQVLEPLFGGERFRDGMAAMVRLRPPLDAFFDHVTVNAPEPELRRNRLRLLARVREAMNRVADFSKIEG